MSVRGEGTGKGEPGPNLTTAGLTDQYLQDIGCAPIGAQPGAVVTGGAQGIGYAIAELVVAEGAQVVIAELDSDAADLAAKRLGGPEVAPWRPLRRDQSVRCG